MSEEEKKSKVDKILKYAKETQSEAKGLLSSSQHRRAVVALLIGGLLLGWIFSGMLHGPRQTQKNVKSAHDHRAQEETIWTCSMHPQIQLTKPGKCPICGMDLIPVAMQEEEGMPSLRRLVMSPDAMKLAEIQTAPVTRKFVSREIRMVGKVEYDETRIAYITAWTGGRIDQLYIDQTGIPVRKGDHTAYIYSPELLSAQEEYLQSLESVEQVKETHLDIIRKTSSTTVDNAREKLKLLGITDQQIKDLEERKVPNDHMTLYAPASGIVVGKLVQEGDYVQTGTRIYSIVDLTEVWIKLDAYESDLEWLRFGQDVEFQAEAYPGEIFHGRISFIDPVLNEVTRTVKVRVNVANEDFRLKPGMFVRAVVRAEVAQGGQVMDTYLSDKWICPMHPEIVKEEPGACPICEMPLVETHALGYESLDEVEPPLVIPASSVLKTGKRAVVYVKNPDMQKPTFEGREILVGPRAGDYYLVKSGLKEGELVVTQGNFKIDSALQIQAKPSMMNPEGGVGGGGHDMSKMGGTASKEKKSEDAPEMMMHAMTPQAFLAQLELLYQGYFDMADALARDEFNAAQISVKGLVVRIDQADMNLLEEKLHAEWMNLSERLKNTIALAGEAKTLEELRTGAFVELSTQILTLEKKFGHGGEKKHFEIFCPMALNSQGASWLQSVQEVMNPFFGTGMQNCGTVKKEYAAQMPMVEDASRETEAAHEGSQHEH